jgi:hypothetical protein
MRHVMRQNRDGEIVVVDLKPGEPLAGADMLRAWRWSTVLRWFARTMAIAWLAKGFLNWAILLGVSPRLAQLMALPHRGQATLIFLGVVELIAAVGLWLGALWGGVLFLTTCVVEALALALGIAPNANRGLIGLVDCVLALTYVFALWRADRERRGG